MPATRPHRTEKGTTLVELIVTVAIMGFAMLAIMGGVGTSIIFGAIQRQDATNRLVLTAAAEKIISEAENQYEPCADKDQYDPKEYDQKQPPQPVPVGYPVEVTRVAFWDPASNRFVAEADLASCNQDADNGLQLVELKVTSTSGGSRAPKAEVLEVVKRQVDS